MIKSAFTFLLVFLISQVCAAETTGIDPLTGLSTTKELSMRHPLAVMVENTRSARPQSGLDKAGIVVESYVEGGVTRYMGLFVSTDADVIGPVRSTRQFYASWVTQFKAWLSHCWAKKTGYATIKKLGVKNIDAVRLRGYKSPFFRVKARYQPHNLYVSTSGLRRLAAARKLKIHALTAPFTFKNELPADQRPKKQYIGLDYLGRTYLAEFRYDHASNTYKRFISMKPHKMGSTKGKAVKKRLNGAPHTRASNRQLSPKNVIVLIMSQRVVDKGGVLEITTTGNGKAMFFIDGKKTTGTWRRKGEFARYQFLDDSGKTIAVNRGQTWISVINSTAKVHFLPIAKYHGGKKLAKKK